MKIYTGTGDRGTTSLIGGRRVAKDDVRLEAYGTVDELNAHIGVLVAELPDGAAREFLLGVQHALFDLGATLALDEADGAAGKYGIAFPAERARVLEEAIDRLGAGLPPLHTFVLPGGTRAAALSHVCRTVCRRAERAICAVQGSFPVPEGVSVYMNRLSDYFFVLGRSLNNGAGGEIFYVKA